MRAIVRYIVKNIASTPVVSIIILIVLSLSSGLFCVAFDFKRQIAEEALQNSLTELGNSTFNMTFDESAKTRFFTLNSLRYDPDFDKNDFEYIVGGYTFTSVLRAKTLDLPIKVFSYKDTSDVTLGGDGVVSKFSDIRFVKKSQKNAVWFDTDVVIPQKMAQEMNVDLGDTVLLLLGGISKEMTVTGIAENRGLFSGDNVLVDYDGLLTTVSSLSPISIPLNIFNIALFRLKQQDKADFYIRMIDGIQDYSDKIAEKSPTYQQMLIENKVKIAAHEAVVYLLIILLFIVVFFLVLGRLRAHQQTIQTLLEQGAGAFSLGALFLTEISLIGFIASVIGASFIVLFGFAASILPALLCLPLCAFAYASRLIISLLKRKGMRLVLLGCVLVAAALLFVFAKNLFYFVLLLILIVATVFAADFFTQLFYRLNHRKRQVKAMKSEQKPSSIAPSGKIKNNGMLWAFAANSSDKTSSVFLVINSILIVILILFFTYTPIMNKLFDTTDAGYVVTNIASAGGDFVAELESIEGVERAMPIYWEEKKQVIRKLDGEEIYAHIITSRQSDYMYAQSMLSISGGEDALKLGMAVISTELSKKMGLKIGESIEVPISGRIIEVEIGAVVKSGLLNNFIILESSGLESGTLPYNNVFLKLNSADENETLTAIRTKYGFQNILIIHRSDLVAKVSSYAEDFSNLIRIILFIVISASFVVLLASFIIKKSRDKPTEQIFKELGVSKLQIYSITALSQLLASLTAIIMGLFLSFAIGYFMTLYLSFLDFTLAFDAVRLIPTIILSEAVIVVVYMFTHVLSFLMTPRTL